MRNFVFVNKSKSYIWAAIACILLLTPAEMPACAQFHLWKTKPSSRQTTAPTKSGGVMR